MASEDTEITLKVTLEQAEAMKSALDLYARVTTGQLEILTDLVRGGTLPLANEGVGERMIAEGRRSEQFERDILLAKSTLGYPAHGSMGIRNPHVDITGKRAWEVCKALTKELAIHRDPKPEFSGPAYDGNFLRLTDDPLPEVTLKAAGAGMVR